MPKSLKDERSRRIAEVGYDFASQPKNYIENCNLCGESQFVIIAHEDRYGFPASAHACMRCGLIFLNPVMTAEAYSEFYQQYYRPLVSAYHGRLIDAITIQEEQREYAANLIEFLKPFLSSRNQISALDIGGSTGIVSYQLSRAFKLEATILDPAPLEIEQAKKLNLKTITSLLEDFEIQEPLYDLVLLCQTVDHLLDAGGAIKKVHTMLKESGYFFVDIVDFRAAYLRNNCIESGIKTDHPYYFTEQSIEKYLHISGFDIARKYYAKDGLHIGYLCKKSSETITKSFKNDDTSKLFSEIRYIQNKG